MATYCYRCSGCGDTQVSSQHGGIGQHNCGSEYVRDYRAEGIAVNGLVEMKKQREAGTDGLSGKKAQRDLFLPTAAENRTKSDPTGQKYIHSWNEKHGPRPANKSPLYPETDKRLY